MDITQAYAIALASIALCLALRAIRPDLARIRIYASLLTSKYLTYNYILNRHAILSPWSAATAVLQTLYLASNIFCLTFGVVDLSHAGRRAGTLSLINLGPLMSGFHLDFLAGLSGLSLRTTQQVHRSTSFAVFALAAFHVVIAAATDKAVFSTQSLDPFVIIAGSTLCVLTLLSWRVFRKPSYEIFLRTHQGLAVACAYSIWRHLPNKQTFPRAYMCAFVGLFGVTSALEGVVVLVRSGLSNRQHSRVEVARSCGMVKLRLHLSQPLRIEPGQYVNLWIPSVSFGAVLQSHPFVVISWAVAPQTTLDIFIQPRRGFTRNLLHLADRGKSAEKRWMMFSGPHGRTVPVGKYERIMMVADGAGIAAHLPLLKSLIHGYNARQIVTRRIHLIWQISDIDVGIAAQPFLNEALDEDKLESGGILQISIYLDSGIPEVPFGRRSTVYPGTADLKFLVEQEIMFRGELPEMTSDVTDQSRFWRPSGMRRTKTHRELLSMERKSPRARRAVSPRRSDLSQYSIDDPVLPYKTRIGSSEEGNLARGTHGNDHRLDVPHYQQDKMLILGEISIRTWMLKLNEVTKVSGFAPTRDTLRKQAQRYLENKVELVELDFQPFRK